MLLYGSNGSGKTTILNLVYHLLHPEPYGGHRSFVGSIPFKTFRVHIADGTVVTAARSRKYVPGSYRTQVEKPLWKRHIEVGVEAGQECREEGEEPDYMQFCTTLQKLGLSSIFFAILAASKEVARGMSTS